MRAERDDQPIMSRTRGRNILVAGAAAVGAAVFGLASFAAGAGLWEASSVGLGAAAVMAGSAGLIVRVGEPK
jgi:hypothetical protein